jgi:hypothetical protein
VCKLDSLAHILWVFGLGLKTRYDNSGASKAWNVDALFFKLRWAQCGFYKERVGTRYAELGFFHPVLSTGDMVHSDASGAQNIDAIFFMLGWMWCGFHKKRTGTWYAEGVFLQPVLSVGHVVHSGPVHPRRNTSTYYFSCLGGPAADSIKRAPGHVTSNLSFYMRCNLRVT